MSREVSRRDFLKAGFAVGGAAFLEACRNLRDEEIRNMPLVSIEEILKDPNRYASRDTLRINGFITEMGTSNREIEQTGPVSRYVWQTDRIQLSRHKYKISNQPDMSGSNLDAVSQEKITDFDVTTNMWGDKEPMDGNALKRSFPKPNKAVGYEVLGRLLKAEKPDPKNPKYVFEIARIEILAKK